MRLSRALLAPAVVFCIVSCAPTAKAPSITIQMRAENGSGETGSATLTQQDDGVLVAVRLENAPASEQPTHIHLGTCRDGNGDLAYGLHMTQDGSAETLVQGVSLGELRKSPHVINVHKSADEMGTYVSCGDIR